MLIEFLSFLGFIFSGVLEFMLSFKGLVLLFIVVVFLHNYNKMKGNDEEGFISRTCRRMELWWAFRKERSQINKIFKDFYRLRMEDILDYDEAPSSRERQQVVCTELQKLGFEFSICKTKKGGAQK